MEQIKRMQNELSPLTSFVTKALLVNGIGLPEDSIEYCGNRNTNVLKTKSGFKIEILAPGFSKDEISVEMLAGDQLLISAKTEAKTKSEDQQIVIRGFDLKNFSRKLQLPKGAVIDRILPTLEHGLLTIEIKFDQQKEQIRRIIPIV